MSFYSNGNTRIGPSHFKLRRSVEYPMIVIHPVLSLSKRACQVVSSITGNPENSKRWTQIVPRSGVALFWRLY